jgi:hypothetical protein
VVPPKTGPRWFRQKPAHGGSTGFSPRQKWLHGGSTGVRTPVIDNAGPAFAENNSGEERLEAEKKKKKLWGPWRNNRTREIALELNPRKVWSFSQASAHLSPPACSFFPAREAFGFDSPSGVCFVGPLCSLLLITEFC